MNGQWDSDGVASAPSDLESLLANLTFDFPPGEGGKVILLLVEREHRAIGVHNKGSWKTCFLSRLDVLARYGFILAVDVYEVI